MPTDRSYYLQAELYDLVYADVVADIAPHVEAALAAGGPVLELCCGTGRLLVPTLEAGVVCDGIDLEPAMLAACRQKLQTWDLSANLVQADMRDFTLPRRYALVTIGFNSFLHNLTQADQLATLRRCHAHLDQRGSLQIVAFHPSAPKLVEWAAGERLAKDIAIAESTDRLRVYDRAVDDRIEQIRHMTRRIERRDEHGTIVEQHELTFDLRYVFKPEMELLLRTAGFARWSVEPLLREYNDPSSAAAAPRAAAEGDVLRWTAWSA